MRRSLLATVVLSLVAAACGDGASPTTAGVTTTIPAPTGAESGDTTTTMASGTEIAGDPAPDFRLALDGGGEFVLSDEERPVLLVFWAEWCPTCKTLLPEIDALADEYGDRIAFVAVAGLSDPAPSREVADRLISEPVVWGLDDGLWDAYAVPYQPTTFFITGGDVVIAERPGPVPTDVLREHLERLLAAAG